MADQNADQLFERWCEFLQVAPEGDLPDVVYHYITSAGLFGILENRSVYATDKHFLNDRTEVRHGTETAISGLRNEQKKSATNSELLRLTCDYMQEEDTETRHFIFSTSERGDDLSQWRGYSNEGNGFTIGFDARRIRTSSLPKDAPYAFNRVSYSRAQFTTLIARISKEFGKVCDTEQDTDNVARCFSATLEAAACYYKHNSFRFEREWRMVSYIYPDEADQISVRNSNGRLLPYVEFPLCGEGETLPVLEIGIGPAVQNPNTRLVIEDLCRRANIEPKIYSANTPYVRY